jgi:hypothetical protein
LAATAALFGLALVVGSIATIVNDDASVPVHLAGASAKPTFDVTVRDALSRRVLLPG